MSRKIIDISGKRFGKLIAKKIIGKNNFGAYIWECECDCGNIKNVSGVKLRAKRIYSCGCFISVKETKSFNIYDLTNKEYGICIDAECNKILFDKEDYDKIKKHIWRFDKKNKYVRSNKNNTIHRIIMDAKKGEIVDHINHNPLDNRKENLRIVTNSQNSMNTIKKNTNTSSRYKGVHFRKDKQKWKAYITINNKQIHLGYFLKEEDAANAYNKKAIELFGEYVYLNNIEENQREKLI